MERSDAITTLEVLKANCSKHSRDYQALDYAVSSLKTDEAYQIMYEGGEIFTKDEVIDILKELRTEIFKQSWRLEALSDGMDGKAVDLDDVAVLFLNRINALRGENNE